VEPEEYKHPSLKKKDNLLKVGNENVGKKNVETT